MVDFKPILDIFPFPKVLFRYLQRNFSMSIRELKGSFIAQEIYGIEPLQPFVNALYYWQLVNYFKTIVDNLRSSK